MRQAKNFTKTNLPREKQVEQSFSLRQISDMIFLRFFGFHFLFFSFNCFAQNEPLSRIAFGSCAMQNGEQLIWNEIVKNEPQLWIWLGDNIYAETQDMNKMKRDYAKLKNNENYQKLLQKCPVIGTWDDHDFGNNDVGGEYPKKKESQQLFLDFFDVPYDSPRRKQEGVYFSQIYGEGDKQVKIILLDTRYFREKPGENADILGEAQWLWLEKELRETTAKINIIASSIQFIANDHNFEKWGHFPRSRDRLLKLIGSSNAPGVIFLSGDRHIAELSRYIGCEVKYPIYDFTSSGLTHDRALYPFEFNSLRVGRVYFNRNFGLILIDWENKRIAFQARGFRGDIKINHLIEFSEIGIR